MRFGFHQVLAPEAQMLTLHDRMDLPGIGRQEFINRMGDYVISDTGSARLCDAAGGFATARWIVRARNP
jgi:hypothetical protein